MSKYIVTDRKFYKTAIVLSAPVVLQSMITIGVNMLDTIMLGNFGEVQLSGSSLANSFVSIYQILCMGIGGGAAVLTAQFWGAKDQPAIRKIVTLMLRICVSLSLLFMAASYFAPEIVMRIYTSDASVIDAGKDYLRIVSPTFLLTGISVTLTIVLRSVREVKLPLTIAIVSFFMNLFFNWIFIFGKLGMPQMEIRGAALATVIARTIETAIIMYFVFRRDKRIQMRFHHLFEPCTEYLPRYLKYSVPVICSDFLLSLGNTAVTIIMGHLSASFVAANSIVALTVRLSTIMNQAFAGVGSIMTGNTLGEGDTGLAHKQGITFLLMSLALGLLASGIILLLCPVIIQAYNITEETRQIAYSMMASVSITVVFQATQSMLTKGVLRGGGDTRFLMVADIAFLWLLSIPLGYLSAFVWCLSPFWIYTVMKIDYVFKTVWCTFRLFGTKWIKIVTKKTPQQQTEQPGNAELSEKAEG